MKLGIQSKNSKPFTPKIKHTEMYMKYLRIQLVMLLFCVAVVTTWESANNCRLASADGNVALKVETGAKMRCSVIHKGETIIEMVKLTATPKRTIQLATGGG